MTMMSKVRLPIQGITNHARCLVIGRDQRQACA